MKYSTEELLRKAVLSITASPDGVADFGGAGQAPLSVEQATSFIELMTAEQVILPRVRVVSSRATKWQETIAQFAGRITRPGNEGVRLAPTDRAIPVTSMVELSSTLQRAEVPVTDEVIEDVQNGFVATLERLIADQAGADIEELMLNGDEDSSDAYLAQFDGWVKQARDGGQAVDGAGYGQDYDALFSVLLQSIPDRFRRNLEERGAFYVPKRTETKIREQRAARGTALGDENLERKLKLMYQGIEIVGVPAFAIGAGNTSNILLAHDQNLYAGFHRAIRFETYRDPREGITSFLVTSRVDAKIGIPDATAIAYGVDVSIT